MLAEILISFIKKNWVTCVYVIPFLSVAVYLLGEWRAAYGFNNLGKTVAAPFGYGRKTLHYNSSNCARAKFLDGKNLSIRNRETLGDIYLQRSGTYKEVVLTTSKQLMEYCKSSSKNHSKLDTFGAGAFLVALLGECLGFQNGLEWSRMRKIYDSFFTHKAAIENFPVMTSYVSEWLENLDPSHISDIDPLQLVNDLPFTCIAKYLYGATSCSKEFLQDLKDLIPMHTELMHYSFLTVAGRFKILQYLPVKKMRQVSHFQKQFTDLSLKQVELSRKTGQETVVEKLYKHVESGRFSFNNWIQTVDEILFANIEVTSTIMSWALVEMASNTEVQIKLRSEILKVIEESNTKHFSKEESNKEVGPMQRYIKLNNSYLQYCVWETLRLHPLLWFSFPEVSSETLFIDGIRISPNTPIVVDQHQINYNSPIWNPSDKPKDFGSKFFPSRFENITLRDALYSQVTFGVGARKCLGKNFAELLIKSELAYILSRYKVSLIEKVEFSENTFVVQPKTRIQLTEW
ncbi:unnamed protein product [Kluyveromyces dobzhanskii CBS 2104]|uniref:WGS project CCBQ000000000 data, contig 00099 n=1 Tax=Kluyveromyces dobzhanskii CBS 2104 TaxID=1427455 RepID=A0A0A8L3V5_9SACH|nr:unnamed protein product [Kluyveromyces dobzhanskii CBS 2104]